MGDWTRRSALGASLGAVGMGVLGGEAFAETPGPVEMWMGASGNLFIAGLLDGQAASMLMDSGNPSSLVDTSYARTKGLASDRDISPTGAPTQLTKPIR